MKKTLIASAITTAALVAMPAFAAFVNVNANLTGVSSYTGSSANSGQNVVAGTGNGGFVNNSNAQIKTGNATSGALTVNVVKSKTVSVGGSNGVINANGNGTAVNTTTESGANSGQNAIFGTGNGGGFNGSNAEIKTGNATSGAATVNVVKSKVIKIH